MATDSVRVVYRKYDGSPHRAYPALRLGEDEHGAWLGVPDGTVATVGAETVVRETAHALLVPHGLEPFASAYHRWLSLVP